MYETYLFNKSVGLAVGLVAVAIGLAIAAVLDRDFRYGLKACVLNTIDLVKGRGR